MMLVVTWLHLIGVVTWMGGVLFASHLVAPRLGRAEGSERSALQELLRRFRVVAWTAIALLIVTGLINLSTLLHAPALLARGAGRILAFKLFLAIVVLMLAAHRDFAILPRLLRAPTQETARPLRSLRWVDRFVLLLLLVILYLGLAVSRSVHS